MPVTIKRSTGWLGAIMPMTIKINDKKIGKIRSDEQIEINIPNKKAQLKVTQLGTKSNRLEVTDGDIIEITTTKWSNWSFFGFIIVLAMTNFIVNTTYRISIVVFVIVLFLITAICLDDFHLKKQEG